MLLDLPVQRVLQVIRERQEQRVPQERLDLSVILEAQDQLVRLGQLELPDLLAQLDLLVQQALPDQLDKDSSQVEPLTSS